MSTNNPIHDFAFTFVEERMREKLIGNKNKAIDEMGKIK